MKKRGEGSIRLRKDGRYEVRYFFQGEPRSQYAKTLEQAEEILKKINAEITLDEHFIPANIKVGDWMKEWLTLYKKKAIKPKTYESYEQIIRCYIVPWLGNISIGRLSSDHIQRMVNDMTQSSRTIKYTITVLKMAMKKAIEKKYIRDMPTWQSVDNKPIIS